MSKELCLKMIKMLIFITNSEPTRREKKTTKKQKKKKKNKKKTLRKQHFWHSEAIPGNNVIKNVEDTPLRSGKRAKLS